MKIFKYNLEPFILIFTFFLVLYLNCKNQYVEHMSQQDIDTEIDTAITNEYKADVNVIKNLSIICEKIINNDNSYFFPSDIDVDGKLIIDNKFTITKDVNTFKIEYNDDDDDNTPLLTLLKIDNGWSIKTETETGGGDKKFLIKKGDLKIDIIKSFTDNINSYINDAATYAIDAVTYEGHATTYVGHATTYAGHATTYYNNANTYANNYETSMQNFNNHTGYGAGGFKYTIT